jgi:uncharacterized membrane protein
MSAVLLLKTVHILSGAVLFGTGLGIAFFMLVAHRTREPRTVAAVASMVVLADLVFTATAVVIQPLTGAWLARLEGFRLAEPWLLASYGLYLLVGACWLPVVWIQLRMKRLAEAAALAGEPLPEAYASLFRVWFILGWPAFAGVIAIYALMVAKPAL